MDISKLGITVVPKRERNQGRSPKVKATCWDTYYDLTKGALQDSILEAKGRFDVTDEQYGPEEKSRGSTFWRPVSGAQGIDEVVEVYWKVGKRKKIPLFDYDGDRYETLRVGFEQVVTLLTAMDAELNKADFKDSFNGKIFHLAAVETSRPKKAEQQGDIFYHSEFDMWLKRADYENWSDLHKNPGDIDAAAAEMLGLGADSW